ncbi:MAG: hypothetical protein IPJ08_04445 [Burkholderiales bacterium]|nr:hypothetical protein [Burkholderiales bacterium]
MSEKTWIPAFAGMTRPSFGYGSNAPRTATMCCFVLVLLDTMSHDRIGPYLKKGSPWRALSC